MLTSDRCDDVDDDTHLLVLRRDDADRNTDPASAGEDDDHDTASVRTNRDSRSSRSYPTAPTRRPFPPRRRRPPRLAS